MGEEGERERERGQSNLSSLDLSIKKNTLFFSILANINSLIFSSIYERIHML